MNLIMHLPGVLLLLGAMLMLINIWLQRKIVLAERMHGNIESTPVKRLIGIHAIFLLFFFLGYLGAFFLVSTTEVDTNYAFVVSVIFFFGAVFVFMGIVIQKNMLESLRNNYEILSTYTEQLQREQQRLREANERLEAEISDRIKAQESDQMKSDFLSLVSHELRTPMTAIFGFNRLIRNELEKVCAKQELACNPERIFRNLDIISDECDRLTRLINNVLDLARIESGKMTWDDQPHDLSIILNGINSIFEGLLIEKTAVMVKLSIQGQLPIISVDKDLFTQVLVNIISNAIKFMEEGTVTITAQYNEELVISIADQGPGIEQEKLEQIFDKFYIVRKGDTLGAKQMGSGLGLPISKEIIEHYHGTISVESTPSKGSTFIIRLPKSIVVDQP